MVKEGLFERFPMERVFGMHNWPGAPEGTFFWREGPIMAAVANLEATITGKGAHGAMPHNGIDPIVVAAAIVQALQSIVARNLEPVDAGVITIAHIQGIQWANMAKVAQMDLQMQEVMQQLQGGGGGPAGPGGPASGGARRRESTEPSRAAQGQGLVNQAGGGGRRPTGASVGDRQRMRR